MTPNFTRRFFLFFFLLSLLTNRNSVQAQAYTENFDNIGLLAGNGWMIQNNSAPVGSISWFQGTATTASPTPGPFNAYAGAANAYIGVNFNSTGPGSSSTISNWLVTPNRTLRNGDVFTFYSRKAPTVPDYPDRLQVRMSTNGASTNVGTTPTSVGDFTTLLMEINPTLQAGVYPQVWTLYTITISGLPAPTSGRIAFRYFVTSAGSIGTNSDYIGIDEVQYTPYVCPPFTFSPAGGALPGATAGTAYSQTITQTGALGDPNFAITAGALPPGLTLSAGGAITGTPTATGTFNFTITVSDASGCTGAQPNSITAVCPSNPISFIAPSLICSNTPVTLEANPAGGTFSGTGVTGGTFDPSVGSQTIYYDYTDPYGCAFSTSATFSVADPGVTAVTPVSQTICSGSNITTIEPTNTISGATFTWSRDNTSSVTGMADNGSGDISGSLINTTTEPVTVTFTITSLANGCTLPVTASVLVNPAPAVVCPGNVSVNHVLNTCSATATYTATATGVPAPTISYSFAGATTGSGSGNGSGATFNVGVTTVTLTATNSCGANSCSFTVTVNDTQNPTITCPAPVTVSCTGEVPVPDISSVTAADNCSGVTISHVDDAISNQTCANKYTITRTYRATDHAGNTATCTQLITVNDETAPVISCPADITATATGSCNATVNFTVNATDNCGGTVTVTTLPVSGSVFPLGTTTVTATATDACGNQSTCTFIVTVEVAQKPIITTPNEICVEDKNIQLMATPAGGSFSGTGVSGNTWNLEIPAPGNHTINYTYTDANGCISNTSKVIKIGFCHESSSVSVLQGYPNPTRGKVILKALVTEAGTYSIGATDLNGRTIWKRNTQLRSGWNAIEVDLTVEKAGMYIITLGQGAGKKGKIKVLKVG